MLNLVRLSFGLTKLKSLDRSQECHNGGDQHSLLSQAIGFRFLVDVLYHLSLVVRKMDQLCACFFNQKEQVVIMDSYEK